MSRPFVSIWVLWGLGLFSLFGCQGKPRPPDASTARATLQRTLDAWQKGTSLEDFQQTSPSVSVVDPQWQEGTRLVQYDLDGTEQPNGFDLRFSVKLSLVDPSGKKSEQKAKYTVSTSPSLVVVRGEEGE